jgi:hypothetical protein
MNTITKITESSVNQKTVKNFTVLNPQLEDEYSGSFVYVKGLTLPTPLDMYKAELLKAGHSKALVNDIIDGLANSPLYATN